MNIRLRIKLVRLLAKWLDDLTGDGTTLINHVPERIEKGVAFLNNKKRSWQSEIDIGSIKGPLDILDSFISKKDRPLNLVRLGFVPGHSETLKTLLSVWQEYFLGYIAYREIYKSI